MITAITEVNNFVVLLEQSDQKQPVTQHCDLDDDLIGISFYLSGKVDLTISHSAEKLQLQNNSGHVTSFFGNKTVKFQHDISPETPLQSISIFSTTKNIQKLPKSEQELFKSHLNELLETKENFKLGPYFYMSPEIQSTVNKVFKSTYTGSTRMLFLKSQVLELLTHFFGQITQENKLSIAEQEKLYKAKSIIAENIEAPPSLSELSKMIGLNDYKLKKNFKELFGVPVFKYLQQQRLDKAHALIAQNEMSIQQAALFVGYESLSSFSKAFLQKFGYRPSALQK